MAIEVDHQFGEGFLNNIDDVVGLVAPIGGAIIELPGPRQQTEDQD